VSRLLIAHGSPDPRHREVMQRLAIATEQRSGQSTCVAYLDHDQPNVDEALSTAANGPAAEHVDALGLFCLTATTPA